MTTPTTPALSADTPESVAARLTLDGAIAHADDVASGCGPCAAEHRQLAIWLRDYRAQAAEIARLSAGQDAGRELMRQAWECLNSFRAQHGSPYCLSDEPFDAFLQSLADMLGDDCKPWMTDAATHLIGPYTITIGQEQDATIAAEERAIRAEADRDALLDAIGFKAGPLGDDLRREAILDDAAGLRPAMVTARRRANEAESSAMLADCFIHERGGLLLRVWEMMTGERRKRRKAGAALAASEAEVKAMREALEPFLDAAAGMADFDMPDEAAVLRSSADHHLKTGTGRPLTFGHFRRLRAALSTVATGDAFPTALDSNQKDA